MWIYRLIAALNSAQLPYAVVGGYAVALHGAVRGTVDIDLVISFVARDFIRIAQTLGELGLESKLPLTPQMVFKFRKEYIKERNLIAWNFYNPKLPYQTVDILLTHDLKKLKTTQIDVGATVIRIVSIPDLIRMKRTAGRPQDLEDIKALEAIQKAKGKLK